MRIVASLIDQLARPSLVFLDSDQEAALGCLILPGDDAPERVIFEGLKGKGWQDVAQRIARSHADLVDATEKTMTLNDHHEWIKSVADKLIIGSNTLWRAMVISRVALCLSKKDAMPAIDRIQSTLDGISFVDSEPTPPPPAHADPSTATEPGQLF